MKKSLLLTTVLAFGIFGNAFSGVPLTDLLKLAPPLCVNVTHAQVAPLANNPLVIYLAKIYEYQSLTNTTDEAYCCANAMLLNKYFLNFATKAITSTNSVHNQFNTYGGMMYIPKVKDFLGVWAVSAGVHIDGDLNLEDAAIRFVSGNY